MRWVAVRHADDHIHVVATLARQDGRRVFPRDDHYRAREASRTVEARYDLMRTSPAGRTSSRLPTSSKPLAALLRQRHPSRAGLARASGVPYRLLRTYTDGL